MTIADTVNDFFNLVQTKGSQDIPTILNLFVPDNPQPPGPPNVGLTSRGPQFSGRAGVDTCLRRSTTPFIIGRLTPHKNRRCNLQMEV
jgi:hypothetical protein